MIRSLLLLLPLVPAVGSPLQRYRLPWTESLPWGTAVTLDAVDDARLAAGRNNLVEKGDGVLWLPVGTFTLKDDLVLRSGGSSAAPTPRTSWMPGTSATRLRRAWSSRATSRASRGRGRRSRRPSGRSAWQNPRRRPAVGS